jgi:hypothetical protein
MNKKKRANVYDPEYIMSRENISMEEAKAYIIKYKADKATNLPNFIKKYGDDEGRRLYNEWQEKSLKKGWDLSKVHPKRRSKLCKEYWLHHGYTLDTAIEYARLHNLETSPLHIEYYIKRGKSIEYAQRKIRALHDKKIGKDGYRIHLETTTDMSTSEIDDAIKKSRGHCSRKALGNVEFDKRIAKTRKTFEDKGLWIPYSDMSDWQLYKNEVWKYTNMNDIKSMDGYDKRCLSGGPSDGTQLDHKYSISMGFINNISPKLIGSIDNLKFVTWKENRLKGGMCSITIEELYNENIKD